MRNRGFTFVELVATAAILVILMALTVGTAVAMRNFYGTRATQKEMRDLGCSLLRYNMDQNAFPSGTDTTGLTNLMETPSPTGGLYTDTQRDDYLRDAWGRPYIYRTGVTPEGVEVALLLSLGPNGRLDSDLSGWTQEGWSPGGDDLAWKISEEWNIKDKERFTLENLKREASAIVAQSPMEAPTNYTPTLEDAFGYPIRYVRCNAYAAFVVSVGNNGRLDSQVCQTGNPAGDDLAVSMEWRPDEAPQIVTPPPPPPPPPPRRRPRPPQPRDPCW